MNNDPKPRKKMSRFVKLVIIAQLLGVGLFGGNYLNNYYNDNLELKAANVENEKVLLEKQQQVDLETAREKRKADAETAKEERKVYTQRYLRELYESVPQHIQAAGLVPISLFGMRPTEGGGQLKVLVGSQEDESLYVFTYESNEINFWVVDIQVIRGSSPFTNYARSNKNDNIRID